MEWSRISSQAEYIKVLTEGYTVLSLQAQGYGKVAMPRSLIRTYMGGAAPRNEVRPAQDLAAGLYCGG